MERRGAVTISTEETAAKRGWIEVDGEHVPVR
jgi:hypothetical protein